MSIERKREITICTIAEEVINKQVCFFESRLEGRAGTNGIDINMSDVYSAMIKEAAKCNYYASDLIYDIEHIKDRLEHFDIFDEDSYMPILVACRKSGVDGNSYILSRTQEASRGCEYAICFPSDYFSVFAVTFAKSEEWSDLGYVDIYVKGIHV